MEYGVFGFVPVLLLLTVAIKTKRTTPALLVGTIAVFLIMEGPGFIPAFISLAYDVGMNVDYVWLVLLIVFLFVLLSILEEIGSSEAFVRIVQKRARGSRSTLVWSWIVAAALFIDETLSCAVLGTLSPIYDKYKVPRASLAYLADSTAAPFTTVIPITAWAVFYQGVFSDYDELAYLGSAFEIYCKAIPFMFYAWAAILIAVLFVTGVIPPLGSMKKAYARAAQSGELYGEESKKYNLSVEAENDPAGGEKPVLRLAVFFFALVFLTAGVIWTQDLLTVAAVDAAIVFVIALVLRLSAWAELMDAGYRGILNTIPLALIIFCAYMFKDSIILLGLPDYVISIFEPVMSPAFFPLFSFLICCVLTFATGSNWGITAVYAAIGIPLCTAIGADPILVIASIVSGATFGAHICFYAEYTVQASILCKIDNMEHALTQLPYGLLGGVLAAGGFLAAGLIR